MRGLLLMGLAWLLTGAAQAEPLEIRSAPVVASEVWVRPSGPHEWQQVDDRTPCTLQLPAGTYDVRLAAPDGLFHRYVGERMSVSSGFDHPTIEMHEELAWPRVVGVLVIGMAGVCLRLFLGQRRRRRNRKALAPRPISGGHRTAAGPAPELTGVTIESQNGSRFTVLRQIGQGANAAIYEVEARDGEHWALKLIYASHAHASSREGRFRREVEICAAVAHPNVVKLLDWGVHDGLPFMVMELLDGEEMEAILKRQNGERLPLPQVLRWMEQLMLALRALHKIDAVHRDIKPANLMVTDKGDLKLMDFGIAHRERSHTLTGHGTMLGTPMYMSPEHMQANVTTSASDIFSCGTIFYELLVGTPPFSGQDPWSLMGQILTASPPPIVSLVPDVPPALSDCVTRMLSQEPEKRPSADEVLGVLRQGPGSRQASAASGGS